jgi:hypothetical protein
MFYDNRHHVNEYVFTKCLSWYVHRLKESVSYANLVPYKLYLKIIIAPFLLYVSITN